MNRRIIIVIAVILIVSMIFTFVKTTEQTIQKNNSELLILNSTAKSIQGLPFSFWFNDLNCTENNTRTYYEAKRKDGSWQVVTVMTCLNQTVRITTF